MLCCPHLLLSQDAVQLLLSIGTHSTPQLLIDISCPHGAQQQTRRPLLLLLINVTDSWTDGSSTISQILFCIPFSQHQ